MALEAEAIIIEFVSCVDTAISAGDWKVDGACDPELLMQRATEFLKSRGWKRNGIDGALFFDGVRNHC